MTISVTRRTVASIIGSLALSSCGGEGGDSTGPDSGFPQVAGVYSISGRFDGLSADEAAFAGTLVLVQASRNSGDLTGSLTMTISAQGTANSTGESPLESASVTQEGAVSFRLGPSPAAGWTFTGTLVGGITITGRHTLTDGQTASFPGTWSATTGTDGTGSLSIATASSGAPLDPDGYTLSMDGAVRDTLGGVDQVIYPALAPGNHTIGLSLVASNCHVQGQNPRLVSIVPGQAASETFEVICSGP
ncbi:MAG TPA: hypothetical protein VFZ90_01215 [Gemmatimonadales bacterium]|jgi:hypothetical protein